MFSQLEMLTCLSNVTVCYLLLRFEKDVVGESNMDQSVLLLVPCSQESSSPGTTDISTESAIHMPNTNGRHSGLTLLVKVARLWCNTALSVNS